MILIKDGDIVIAVKTTFLIECFPLFPIMNFIIEEYPKMTYSMKGGITVVPLKVVIIHNFFVAPLLLYAVVIYNLVFSN